MELDEAQQQQPRTDPGKLSKISELEKSTIQQKTRCLLYEEISRSELWNIAEAAEKRKDAKKHLKEASAS